MKAILFLLLLVGMPVSCAPVSHDGDPIPLPSPSPSPSPSPEEEEEVEKVKLFVFSAPWCEPCHVLHRGLMGQVEKLTHVEVTTYVETGAGQNQQPTEASCKLYKEKLGASYAFVPDPWRSQLYKKYIGNSVIIPAAVVLDANNNVIRRFTAGTFSANELLSYLDQLGN